MIFIIYLWFMFENWGNFCTCAPPFSPHGICYWLTARKKTLGKHTLWHWGSLKLRVKLILIYLRKLLDYFYNLPNMLIVTAQKLHSLSKQWNSRLHDWKCYFFPLVWHFPFAVTSPYRNSAVVGLPYTRNTL